MNLIDQPIIITHSYPSCTSEQLWHALTNISEMKQWYFEAIPDFKPEVGFYTSFLLTNEGRDFTHQFKVLEVVEGQMIKYTFNFAEYDGDGYVQFDLKPSADECTLTLTSVVTKPYPSDIPEFKRESGVAGWNYFLKDRLDDYMQQKIEKS